MGTQKKYQRSLSSIGKKFDHIINVMIMFGISDFFVCVSTFPLDHNYKKNTIKIMFLVSPVETRFQADALEYLNGWKL